MLRYVTLCDVIWRNMAICGAIRRYMALYDVMGICSVMCRDVMFSGDTWCYVALCGDMWRYVGFCGVMWL